MSLLAAKHKDTASAALSITTNRASKVRLLRVVDDGAKLAGLPVLASKYELELYRDVLAFISDESPQSVDFYRQLAQIALSALPEDAAS